LPDVDKPIVVKTNKYISRRIFSQDGRFFASENDKPSVYTSIGRHSFSYAAPQIWNTIPLNIRISL